MVSPAEWGPKAWELLHSIVEHVGNHTKNNLIRDEQLELKLTLRQFGSLLPCQKCQIHYREWIRLHMPDTTKYAEFLKEDMRKWVYDLHEDVNKRRGITSGITLESMKSRYESTNPRDAAIYLRSFYQRGVQSGILKPEEWKSAWRHLDMLLRILG